MVKSVPEVEEAKVTVGPSAVWLRGPIAVTAAVKYEPKSDTWDSVMERLVKVVMESTEVVPVSMKPLYEEVRYPLSLLNQESCTDDEAIELTLPPVPKYANPWESDESRRSPEMVDEAVEKNPLSNPRVVEVET